MTRLLDEGLDRLRNLIIDMASLSEKSVSLAIDSYDKGVSAKKQVSDWSSSLTILQETTSDLAFELILRYQPVAGDLRFIRSCIEIAYGFTRFGRYAYDIMEVLETIGALANCDKRTVMEASRVASQMISISVKALYTLDKDAARQLYLMDDEVDAAYRQYFKKVISSDQNSISDPKCYASALLILRYLERISDHACYIADSVHYIVTAEPSSRR